MKLLQNVLAISSILHPPLPSPSPSPAPHIHSWPGVTTTEDAPPASKQFAGWFNAFNSQSLEALNRYHSLSPFPPNSTMWHENIYFEHSWAVANGVFHILEFEDSHDDPSSTTVLLVAKEHPPPRYFRVTMEVDPETEGYPITAFRMNNIVTPLKYIPESDPRRPIYEKALQPLTNETRYLLVQEITKVIRDQYIKPFPGKLIASTLESLLESGAYDSIISSEEFSQVIMRDLQKAQRLQRGPEGVQVGFWEPPPPREENAEADSLKIIEMLRKANFGFGEVEIKEVKDAKGKTRVIATLPIHQMIHMGGPPYMSKEQRRGHVAKIEAGIGEIMESVASVDALIIDLRDNRGGDPNTVAFILSFLVGDAAEEKVHLFDMVDKKGSVNQTFETTPIRKMRFRAGTKAHPMWREKGVWVLTNGNTMGMAENMVYNLRALGRVDAVVGEDESTAGVAVQWERARWIAEEIFGKGWWMVMAPSLKVVNPITKGNWDGEGVKSDVVALGKHKWGTTMDVNEIARRMAQRRFDAEWLMAATKLETLREAQEYIERILGNWIEN